MDTGPPGSWQHASCGPPARSTIVLASRRDQGTKVPKTSVQRRTSGHRALPAQVGQLAGTAHPRLVLASATDEPLPREHADADGDHAWHRDRSKGRAGVT